MDGPGVGNDVDCFYFFRNKGRNSGVVGKMSGNDSLRFKSGDFFFYFFGEVIFKEFFDLFLQKGVLAGFIGELVQLGGVFID